MDRYRTISPETASEEKYKTFIKVSKTGAWEYYPGTKLLWFSDEYFSMLDYNINDFKPFDKTALDRCWINLLHDDDRDNATRTFSDYLENRNQELYENYFRLRRADGEYAWILSRALKMNNPDGSLFKIIGTHINISELKELEQRKLEYEKQLSHSRKLEALGTLSGGIAHDFNNILTAILGNTELAKATFGDQEQIEYLDSIEEASFRGKSMVDEILNFARTDTKNYKTLTIGSIVREVVQFLSPTLTPNITLTSTVEADPEITGDALQIYQVMINLCTNALQAIDEESGFIRVTLKEKQFISRWQNKFVDIAPGKYLLLRIEDSGKGMDETTQEKIFEPFFTTKKENGTGLGMFLVYGIMKSHGGTISLSSSPGNGAEFSLFFPVTGSRSK